MRDFGSLAAGFGTAAKSVQCASESGCFFRDVFVFYCGRILFVLVGGKFGFSSFCGQGGCLSLLGIVTKHGKPMFSKAFFAYILKFGLIESLEEE